MDIKRFYKEKEDDLIIYHKQFDQTNSFNYLYEKWRSMNVKGKTITLLTDEFDRHDKDYVVEKVKKEAGVDFGDYLTYNVNDPHIQINYDMKTINQW